MKNKLLLLSLGALCIGCSAGNQDKVPNSTPPVGPVSYSYVNAIYSDPDAQKLHNKSLNASSFSCQSPLQIANWGLSIVRLFTSFIPGPIGTGINTGIGVASTALNIAGSLEGNSCQSVEINIMNQELQQQQQQINKIESTLGLTQNSFYMQNVATQQEIQATDQYLYNQDFLNLAGNTASGIDGSFQQFMMDSTLWNQYAAAQPNITVESIIANPTAITQLTDFISSNSTFTNLVTNLSGSQYNQNNCTINCYQSVQGYSNSSLTLVYNALFNQLDADINAGINNQKNIVPLFDEYNQSIVALYLKSAYALQEAYFMEQLINQINILSPKGTQLGSLGHVPGTWFSYDSYPATESQGYYVQQYNNAQTQLTQMYAARFNQLYINALNYIVSDKPKGNQSIPQLIVTYNFNNTTYSENLSSVYQNISESAATPLELLFSGPNALSNNLLNSTFVYQFSGLSNVQTCESALNTYNSITQGKGILNQGLNAQNCPALFAMGTESAYNQSIYSGNSLKSYFASPYESPLLGGLLNNAMAIPQINGVPVANSTAACQSNQNLYWFTYYSGQGDPLGTPTLTCNLWQTSTDLIINNFAPNWTMDVQSYYIDGVTGWLNWGYSNMVYFPYQITPISADSWTYFQQMNSDENAMSGYSPQNIPSYGIAVGNMPTNYINGNPYSVHQMAFQVTSANGFTSSFVLQFINHAGWDGNYIGVTCNQKLNNVGFVNPDGSVSMIQQSCDQTTNNPASVTVGFVTISPPAVTLGGEYVWNYYSIYNFGN